MKKILFATAASAAFLAATPALAQDAPVAVSGPRVEALVGYDRVRAAGEKDGGVLFGIGAGYDFAVGNGVSLGADIEATESTQKEGDEDIAEIKAGRDLYAGARATFAVSPNANLYVKGGYTNARFKATDGVDTFAENFDGFRLGAGGQYGIGGKAYVGGEYRYSNYEAGLSRHQVALTVGTRF
ncbi:MAG: porin family protein [Pseudomonadota bacterium]|nr:porin family protein [Pseudomonadota bacterium]